MFDSLCVTILHPLQALSLLTYLLQTADPDYVSQLDPLPESLPLPAELTKQLEEATCLSTEIDRFLSVGVCSSRSEGIRALGKLLHRSRFEMAAIIKQGNGHISEFQGHEMPVVVEILYNRQCD